MYFRGFGGFILATLNVPLSILKSYNVAQPLGLDIVVGKGFQYKCHLSTNGGPSVGRWSYLGSGNDRSGPMPVPSKVGKDLAAMDNFLFGWVIELTNLDGYPIQTGFTTALYQENQLIQQVYTTASVPNGRYINIQWAIRIEVQ
jgi:hypothetical protein